MADFDVSIKGQDELAKRLLDLGRDMPLVVARAVKRTAGTVQTAMIRQIMAATGLPRALIRQSINLTLATTRDPTSTLRLWGGRRPLIKFSASKRREFMPSRAFMATMPTGHKGIFERTPGARAKQVRPGVWHSLPIREVLGPPLTEFAEPLALTALAHEKLAANLEHEIQFLIQQRSGAA